MFFIDDQKASTQLYEQSQLENRLDYLSVQVERLIDQHRDTETPLSPFRKAAMLTAQTFEQEVAALKILGAVSSLHQGNEPDLTKGLLHLPDEVIELLNDYSQEGIITPEEERELLRMIIGGGESTALDLQKA